MNFVQLRELRVCLLSTANNKQSTEQSFWSHVGTDSWGMDELYLSLWLAEKFKGNLKGLAKSCLLTDFLENRKSQPKNSTVKLLWLLSSLTASANLPRVRIWIQAGSLVLPVLLGGVCLLMGTWLLMVGKASPQGRCLLTLRKPRRGAFVEGSWRNS